MTTWEEIRDEIAGMLADGKPLEDVITKLEKRKNEMAKANLIAVMDEMKKPKPMTNEEWIKSLDTEGLVDYLYEVHKGGNSVERQRWIENHKERVKMQFRGWLKEIHNE